MSRSQDVDAQVADSDVEHDGETPIGADNDRGESTNRDDAQRVESGNSSEGIDGALTQSMARGLKWSAGGVALVRAANILTGIALARLLVPEDFGVYAPAFALVNILIGVNDLGLLLAVVRWRGDLRVAARTANSIAIGSSTVLYVVAFVGAPSFAEAMGSPDSAAVLRVLALAIVIDGWTTVSHGLLAREFQQDRLIKADLAALPLSITTSVALALAGAGVWALAIGPLLGNIVTGALVYRAAPFRPGFGFSYPVARKMLAYGLPLAGTSLVEYGLLNVDYLIVSRATDLATLGIYLLAFNISSWPTKTITEAVRRVSIAGFAKLEDETEFLKAGFARALTTLLKAALPLVVAMALLAVPLIGFLYGEQWLPAAPVLQTLMALSFARVAIGFIFDLLVGVGRTRTTMALKTIWLVVLVPALVYGVRADGIQGAAVAHALVACLVALPLFAIGAQRAGADMVSVLRSMVRPVFAAFGAGALGWAVRDHLGGHLTTLAAGASVVLIGYLSIVLRRGSVVAARQWIRTRKSSTQRSS